MLYYLLWFCFALFKYKYHHQQHHHQQQLQQQPDTRTSDADDELGARREDHNRIFELWERCGWPLSEVIMEDLLEMYRRYGLQKVLDAIRITGASSPAAPMLYLRKVITATGQPPEKKQTGTKRVSFRDFDQRTYPDDDDMEQMKKMMSSIQA